MEGVKALQILNALLGFATVLVLLRWLSLIGVSHATRLATIAIIALNPRFIIVNGRLTNDTLAILLAASCAILLHLYFVRPRAGLLYSSAAAIVLASATKGSTVSVLALFLICLILPWHQLPRGEPGSVGYPRRLATAALVAVLVFFGGTYARNLANYGTPFTLNEGKVPKELYESNDTRPFWYVHDEYFSDEFDRKQPPWGAVAWESFITFRIFDLVRHPYNDKSRGSARGIKPSPSHMRSVWTQIYARANSARFHPVPLYFRGHKRYSVEMRRIIFGLALVPVALVLLGLSSGVARGVRALRDSVKNLLFREPDLVQLLLFLLTFSFAAAYNYRLGHFSATKPVYYFPGICSFLFFFARGREWLVERSAASAHRCLRVGADVAVGGLVILYALDIGSLIVDLWRRAG
jgi:hypothetical protein